MQLEQSVFGVGEGDDVAMLAHVAARDLPSTEVLDPLREGCDVSCLEHDHAALRARRGYCR